MQTAVPRALVLVAALAAAPVVAACGISVDKDDDGRNANVDIKSPFGSVSVQADKDTPPDTGLPVRPGARVSRDEDHDNANVNVQSGPFARQGAGGEVRARRGARGHPRLLPQGAGPLRQRDRMPRQPRLQGLGAAALQGNGRATRCSSAPAPKPTTTSCR